jgi:hypothetical protein
MRWKESISMRSKVLTALNRKNMLVVECDTMLSGRNLNNFKEKW